MVHGRFRLVACADTRHASRRSSTGDGALSARTPLLTRRPLLGLAAAALARPAIGQARDFVVASNGDPYESMWRRSLIPEFEKQTGFRVVWSPGLSAQILAKVAAQRSRPQIDVALVDEGPFIQGMDIGLWDKFDRTALGDTSSIVPSALDYEYGVAYGFSSVGLYYNAEIFDQRKLAPPASSMDLLRPEFDQKITILSAANTAGINSLLAMNAAAGGETPGRMDPGFDLARRIAKQCLTIDNFGDTTQLVQQRTAISGMWTQARVVSMAETGFPIRFVAPKEGVWGHRFMGAAVKGRPAEYVAAAKAYLALMLTAPQQKAALSLNPLPVNTSVTGTSGIDLKDVRIPDQRVIQQNRAAWVERWGKEVERR